jgi:hypothetical protein
LDLQSKSDPVRQSANGPETNANDEWRHPRTAAFEPGLFCQRRVDAHHQSLYVQKRDEKSKKKKGCGGARMKLLGSRNDDEAQSKIYPDTAEVEGVKQEKERKESGGNRRTPKNFSLQL